VTKLRQALKGTFLLALTGTFAWKGLALLHSGIHWYGYDYLQLKNGDHVDTFVLAAGALIVSLMGLICLGALLVNLPTWVINVGKWYEGKT